jgi:hypothetical protein
MSIRRKQQLIRKSVAVGARRPAVALDPFKPGVSKAELRGQVAEAVASYEGPITRCAPKRRRAPW